MTRTARSSSSSSATPRLELALDAALRLAVGDVAPLVAAFLAAPQRQLDLGAAVLEVQAGRDEREALLGHLGGEPLHLAAVQEELSRAVGAVRPERRLSVGRDGEAHQPQPPVARLGP